MILFAFSLQVRLYSRATQRASLVLAAQLALVPSVRRCEILILRKVLREHADISQVRPLIAKLKAEDEEKAKAAARQKEIEEMLAKEEAKRQELQLQADQLVKVRLRSFPSASSNQTPRNVAGEGSAREAAARAARGCRRRQSTRRDVGLAEDAVGA